MTTPTPAQINKALYERGEKLGIKRAELLSMAKLGLLVRYDVAEGIEWRLDGEVFLKWSDSWRCFVVPHNKLIQ